MLEQLVGVVAVSRRDGDPDAASDADVMPLHLHRLAQRFQDPLPQQDHVFGALRADADHREFVAAQPRHHAVADATPQPVGDAPQQCIAGRMTVRVVDLLEAIEIDAEDGHAVVAVRCGKRLLHAFAEQKPVGKTGQGVMPGHVGDALLGPALLGDVLMGRHPAAVRHPGVHDAYDAPVGQLGRLARDNALGGVPRQIAFDILAESPGGLARFQKLAQAATRSDEVGGEPVHLHVMPVGHGDPVVPVEHHEALAHVVQCGVEAQVLGRQLLLARAQQLIVGFELAAEQRDCAPHLADLVASVGELDVGRAADRHGLQRLGDGLDRRHDRVTHHEGDADTEKQGGQSHQDDKALIEAGLAEQILRVGTRLHRHQRQDRLDVEADAGIFVVDAAEHYGAQGGIGRADLHRVVRRIHVALPLGRRLRHRDTLRLRQIRARRQIAETGGNLGRFLPELPFERVERRRLDASAGPGHVAEHVDMGVDGALGDVENLLLLGKTAVGQRFQVGLEVAQEDGRLRSQRADADQQHGRGGERLDADREVAQQSDHGFGAFMPGWFLRLIDSDADEIPLAEFLDIGGFVLDFVRDRIRPFVIDPPAAGAVRDPDHFLDQVISVLVLDGDPEFSDHQRIGAMGDVPAVSVVDERIKVAVVEFGR